MEKPERLHDRLHKLCDGKAYENKIPHRRQTVRRRGRRRVHQIDHTDPDLSSSALRIRILRARRPVSRRDRVRRALATLVLQVILAPREAVITDLIEERDTRDTGVSESARHEIQILATTAPSHAVEYRARDRLALELEILARETARTLQIIYETRLAAALVTR